MHDISAGAIIGIVLTVVFGIVAIVQTIRVARKQKPTWAYRTTHIIGLGSGAPPELKVTFAGQEVADVYRTLLLFCNKGNEKLERDDVASQLIVRFRSAQVLKVTVLRRSRDAITFEADLVIPFDDANDAECAELRFDWLGHGDGATVEVLHTKCDDATLTAEFKNTRIHRLIWGNVNLGELWQMTLFVAFAGVFFLVALLWGVRPTSFKPSDIAGISFVALGFFVVTVVGPVRSRVRYFSIPKWARKT